MIKLTEDNVNGPSYERIVNQPNVAVLTEQFYSDKLGIAHVILKYDESIPSSKIKDIAPWRI